jgi:hypothetical protein
VQASSPKQQKQALRSSVSPTRKRKSDAATAFTDDDEVQPRKRSKSGAAGPLVKENGAPAVKGKGKPMEKDKPKEKETAKQVMTGSANCKKAFKSSARPRVSLR